MAVIHVERKPLTFAERTYLPQVFGGLMITIRHFFGRRVTLEYPEQRPEISPGYRGVPTLVKDPNGREKCVSCQLCEFVCPPKAIRIVPGEIPANAPDAHVEKAPQEFEINMLRCIYCGYCEEVCPEEAIFLKNDFAMAGYRREELQFHKEKLLELGGVQEDSIWKWKYKGEPPLDAPGAPKRVPTAAK